MTTFDGVVLAGFCGLVYGIAELAAKLASWILWRRMRKLAKQRLAHPEVDA